MLVAIGVKVKLPRLNSVHHLQDSGVKKRPTLTTAQQVVSSDEHTYHTSNHKTHHGTTPENTLPYSPRAMVISEEGRK